MCWKCYQNNNSRICKYTFRIAQFFLAPLKVLRKMHSLFCSAFVGIDSTSVAHIGSLRSTYTHMHMYAQAMCSAYLTITARGVEHATQPYFMKSVDCCKGAVGIFMMWQIVFEAILCECLYMCFNMFSMKIERASAE